MMKVKQFFRSRLLWLGTILLLCFVGLWVSCQFKTISLLIPFGDQTRGLIVGPANFTLVVLVPIVKSSGSSATAGPQLTTYDSSETGLLSILTPLIDYGVDSSSLGFTTRWFSLSHWFLVILCLGGFAVVLFSWLLRRRKLSDRLPH